MYEKICDFQNLLSAYQKARCGNRYKTPVCRFDFFLESNLYKLREELFTGRYLPSPYKHFKVIYPKERQVAAPHFRDRIVQHALVSVIGPVFDRSFVHDSYACRKNKGTHFALTRVKKFLQASRTMNGKNRQVYILKADIKKYFSSIRWDILLTLVEHKIKCPQTMELINKIITTHKIYGGGAKNKPNPRQLSWLSGSKVAGVFVSVETRRGLPIGNLTSQLLANVYLNELDQFVKQELRERWYGRYMDDFFIISADRRHLKLVKKTIEDFLMKKLKLELHPHKTLIQNVSEGVCFVGYRIFYDHVLVRGSTLLRIQRGLKRRYRQFKAGRISQDGLSNTISSFKGHLKHADTFYLQEKMFRH